MTIGSQLQRLGHKMSTNKRKDSPTVTSNGNATLSQNNVQKTQTEINSRQNKQMEREEREGIVIWKRPVTTLEYFAKEVFILLQTYGQKYV